MTSLLVAPTGTQKTICAKGGKQTICLPEDYQKYDLPETNEPTVVVVGVDIKDIPKVEDKDFSITINAYFMVKWRDTRLELHPLEDVTQHKNKIKVTITFRLLLKPFYIQKLQNIPKGGFCCTLLFPCTKNFNS